MKSRLFGLLILGMLSVGYVHADEPAPPPQQVVEPPGFELANSEPGPKVIKSPAEVKIPVGRFYPMVVAGGKPALVLGNDAGLVTLYAIEKGHSILGVRFDEPVGAKPKQYKFPTAVTIALAGEVGGSVTLTSIINGVSKTDPPAITGKLVLTLTGPIPPDVPPDIPPEQVSKLVLDLRAAFSAESAEDKALLPSFVAFYTEAQGKVTTSKTWGDLQKAMGQLASEKNISGKLELVQTVIQRELKASIPWKLASDTTIDANGQQTAKATFAKIADALKKVK